MKHTIRYAPDLDPHAVNGRIVRNPNYSGQALSLNGWRSVPLREVRKPGLQEALEHDIAEEGFRNPILVYSIPEGIYLCFGGSRLRAGQKLFKPVPALINDYCGRFDGYPEVTEANHLSYFTDEPCWFEFGEHGYDYHYGLERMRREEWADQSEGLNWARGKGYDLSWIKREMPWLAEYGIILDDTPNHSEK